MDLDERVRISVEGSGGRWKLIVRRQNGEVYEDHIDFPTLEQAQERAKEFVASLCSDGAVVIPRAT